MKEDYKTVITQMKNHRKNYLPLLEFFLEVHNRKDSKVVQIKDFDLLMVTIELLDNEYLEKDNFQIDYNKNDISNVWYNSKYPLTQKGENLIYLLKKEKLSAKIKKILLLFVIVFSVLFLFKILNYLT